MESYSEEDPAVGGILQCGNPAVGDPAMGDSVGEILWQEELIL